MFNGEEQVKINNKDFYFWLGVSLLFALYYGLFFYYQVFSHEYIVQDDARHHVVWLQKFIDPKLFPNDLIADYFQSLAPLGFKALYFLMAKIGIQPIVLAKILPPILGLITTVYIYLFSLEILPLASCAFLSSLFVNQLIWLNDDLVSATPRAFLYPILAAFLYYLSKKELVACLLLMLLQGLFYPQLLLVEIIVFSLNLLIVKDKILFKFTSQKEPYIWWILGGIVTAIALFSQVQKPPELAILVTAQQMQQMPEFNSGGRTPFFGGGWFNYWLAGDSGLSLPLFPSVVWSGLALPFLLKTKLPITKLITKKISILIQVAIASILMFIAAHILLPKLHLPNRYTYHSLRLVMAITTAIVLTILIDIAKNWLLKKLQSKTSFKTSEKIKIAVITIFSITIIVLPAIPYVFTNWCQNWKIGTATEIYQYLAGQPKDTLVASLSKDADNIPAFSQRSILIGGEFAFAYHPIYYNQFKQRTIDLLEAQYSPNPKVLKSFIQKYKVDYLLLDNNAFTANYLLDKNWLVNSSWSAKTNKNISQLESNVSPALLKFVLSCSVRSTGNLNLVDSNCIVNNSNNDV
ncbi:hypothetical protein [Pleurocapsa sp. FMAR1]|uniref:hypothetical protein n=1 Tax=Pleurocapsa sp. FMAR1 TaxID=3040204 RepID=UPI0029C825C8|nr:hypothetical protein [Pleurocapsa sp. FMAR1]